MKLRSIQVLRGLAAMAVVAHHAFPGRAEIGAAGVDLFFVISGFIMATCASDREPAEFLWDRAWRIYPLWLLAVTPWLLMDPPGALVLVRSITLWPVFGEQFVNPALGVGWTLSFEIVFYLGFAVALRWRPALPLALFALCLILGFTTDHVLFWFLGSPLTFEFLLGAAIARVPVKPWPGSAAMAIGAAWFVFAPTGYYDQAFGLGALYRTLAWGVPASMLLYGARSFERPMAARAFDLPVLLGSASYSIYLLHPLVFLKTSGVVGFLLSPVAGIAAYAMVERQIMRARPRWRSLAGEPLAPDIADAPLLSGVAPCPSEAVIQHGEHFTGG